MDEHRKQSQLASIDNSVLSRVAGGESLDDLFDSWSWAFASQSCRDSVVDAARGALRANGDPNGWEGGWWASASEAGLDAWNGPACSYWGW